MQFLAAAAVSLALLPPATPTEPVRSRPVGRPWAGRLVNGMQLPEEGESFFTWNMPRKVKPNPGWRRWGTDRTIARLMRVLDEFRAAHPGAQRIGIADLSRRGGGAFGPDIAGGLGHASHQNGLDVDVLYPRRDGLEREPLRPGQVDRRLSQDLVDRFVRAGAQRVFVGWRVRLRGPRRVVEPLVHHDDHLHVRFRP